METQLLNVVLSSASALLVFIKIISSLSFTFFHIIGEEEVGKSENQGEREKIREKEESEERKERCEDVKGRGGGK